MKEFLFNKIFPGRFNDGSRLTPTGRDELEYFEGKKRTLVYCELRDKEINRAIDVESFTSWKPPYDGTPISMEKRREILRKICMYFNRIGITYTIIKGVR